MSPRLCCALALAMGLVGSTVPLACAQHSTPPTESSVLAIMSAVAPTNEPPSAPSTSSAPAEGTATSRRRDSQPIALSSDPLDLEQGRKLFEVHCAACHGPGGEGGKGPTLAQPTLPRASDDASLFRIVREGINGTEMPRARMPREEVALVAAFVKSLGSKPVEPVPGDPLKGAELFATKGTCLQCHTVEGRGGAFGPDLTEIGRRRSADYLRRSLIDPSAEVPQSFSAFRSDIPLPENFLHVRVVPRAGETEITGVRVNEDTFTMLIRDVNGRVHSFFKSEVAELHKEFGKSPMPSYAETLTPQELDDLVAYLVSLRGVK